MKIFPDRWQRDCHRTANKNLYEYIKFSFKPRRFFLTFNVVTPVTTEINSISLTENAIAFESRMITPAEV